MRKFLFVLLPIYCFCQAPLKADFESQHLVYYTHCKAEMEKRFRIEKKCYGKDEIEAFNFPTFEQWLEAGRPYDFYVVPKSSKK